MIIDKATERNLKKRIESLGPELESLLAQPFPNLKKRIESCSYQRIQGIPRSHGNLKKRIEEGLSNLSNL